MDPGSERRGASAEPEWEMLTLRGLAMTDETASEFTGTLVIHRAGSPEPVENVRVRIKRSVLEELGSAVRRLLARSTPFPR
jgi:hypothetical protein